ncbi:hypothetical protein [Sorangium sp. So ce233]|uniref:hypothetical protein n=1 Tax=Sorangium sp. So ce233 TaxID=3133290 RepID=UPI003F5E4F89
MSTPATLSPPLVSETDYVAPEGAARERAMEARFARSGGLVHREWMARVLAATWEQINQLAAWAGQAHCLITGGLSSIWIEPRRLPHPPHPGGDLA